MEKTNHTSLFILYNSYSVDINHIAKLARLDLTAEELKKYSGQLSVILGYIDMLKEVDTNGVEPTAQVSGLLNVSREDRVEPWPADEREAILSDAPEREGNYIKVRRVLE